MERFRPEGWERAEACALPETMEQIGEAIRDRRVLEGVVTRCDRDLTLHVSVGRFSGVIGRGEIQYSRTGGEVRDIAAITRVGKPVCFRVTGIGGDGVLQLSRRAVQEEFTEEVLLHARAGDILDAKVTHMEQFGAFLDIGCGVVSLLPIDCISVSRIPHPRDRFRVGQELRVVVRGVDRDTGRVYVTHRELLGTWEENAARFSPGQTVAGVVRSVEEYGIFVELAPNLAGLAEVREGVCPGQIASVYIKNLLPERMKCKLVIVDTSPARPPLQPAPLSYFLPETVRHIDRWDYSPPGAAKRIGTVFEEE